MKRRCSTRLSPLVVQVRLKPVHVLQCHSRMDSREDFSTQLWSCSFQPAQSSAGTDPSRSRRCSRPQLPCQMK